MKNVGIGVVPVVIRKGLPQNIFLDGFRHIFLLAVQVLKIHHRKNGLVFLNGSVRNELAGPVVPVFN
jgi:hypothetical protein